MNNKIRQMILPFTILVFVASSVVHFGAGGGCCCNETHSAAWESVRFMEKIMKSNRANTLMVNL